jgi:hypothetical protein
VATKKERAANSRSLLRGYVPFPEVLRLQIQTLPLLIEWVKSQDADFSVGTYPGWVDPHNRILLRAKGTYARLIED